MGERQQAAATFTPPFTPTFTPTFAPAPAFTPEPAPFVAPAPEAVLVFRDGTSVRLAEGEAEEFRRLAGGLAGHERVVSDTD